MFLLGVQEPSWRYASEALEVAGKVALVHKPGGESCIGNGSPPPQERSSARDSHLHLVSMRRHSNLSAKRSMQMVRAQSSQSGEIVKRHAFSVVFIQEPLRSLHRDVLVSVSRSRNACCAMAAHEPMEEPQDKCVSSQPRLGYLQRPMHSQEARDGFLVGHQFHPK